MMRLVITMTALCAAIAAGAYPAAAQAPRALTGEQLACADGLRPGDCAFAFPVPHPATIDCITGFATFRASGVAAGPYPGTFTEAGRIQYTAARFETWNPRPVLAFSAEFTIQTPFGQVTGTKSLSRAPTLGQCLAVGDGFDYATVTGLPACYEARLPSGAIDRGIAQTNLTITEAYVVPATVRHPYTQHLVETFVSAATNPAQYASLCLTLPTTADQCKNGGWQSFGFRNQGQCVSFVNRQDRG